MTILTTYGSYSLAITLHRCYIFPRPVSPAFCFNLNISRLLQSCIPIMDDLGKAALRSRHWKQLARSTGSTPVLTSESLNRMTLHQFLKLGLQNHCEEVRCIVKRSSRDVHIENMLKLYEEIWLSKVFEMKRHSRLVAGAGCAVNEVASASVSFSLFLYHLSFIRN